MNNKLASFSLEGPTHVYKNCNQDFLRVKEINDGLLIVVCDGHGLDGHLAAVFASEYFATAAEVFYQGDRKKINALFAAVDAAIAARYDGGTTASVALIRPGSLNFYYVGDCDAFCLPRRGVGSIKLSRVDHSPSNPDERNRLEAQRSNCVVDNKVYCGGRSIQICRSLGDGVFGDLISCEPSLASLSGSLFKKTRYLLIGSDGFWFIFKKKLPAFFLSMCKLFKEKPSLDQALIKLHDLLLDARIYDDTSLVVVDLDFFQLPV